jgi:hypothetical protein
MLDLDAIEARAEAALDVAEILVCPHLLHGREHERADPTIYDSQCSGRVCVVKGIVRTMRPDIPALVAELRAARADITEMAYRGTALSGAVDRLEGIVATQAAELRAAREVVEAATEVLEPTDLKRDGWNWNRTKALQAALAAYRAVVGEQE